MSQKKVNQKYDLLCIGGGIMSATLALMTKLLDPDLKVVILERLDEVAQESTEVLNNAGTGHSAFCELNYTPQAKDGSIDISKALRIFSQFEHSKAFWAFLVEKGLVNKPEEFIRNVPHHSWVRGETQVKFLKKRFDKMKQYMPFEKMEYTEDFQKMADWFPLIMEGRKKEEPLAATRMEAGTEINFETLTKRYFKILAEKFDTVVIKGHEVQDLHRQEDNGWLLDVENLNSGEKFQYESSKVFIGAGGGALPLLQKSEIDERKNYGGFPVSGQWLLCNNKEVVKKHHAKVYSRAGEKAPPMAEPHLDSRIVNGKEELVFGPFAGFSTKFLKEGSYLDLPKSIKFENIPAYWGAFWHNLDLTEYLLEQITMNHEDRMDQLRAFIKEAKSEEWQLSVAGQRVQVIKRDDEKGGDVEFGTDTVSNKDGTVAALLGASPGASTSVYIMLQVLKSYFPDQMSSRKWKEKLNEMLPFWNRDMEGNEAELKKLQKECGGKLRLKTLH